MPIRAFPVLLLIVACGGEAAPGADAPPATDTGPDAAAATGEDRPETRMDTLMLEGMPEPIALRLFRAPGDFPLPFTAYVPQDMDTETPEIGEGGAGLRFVARFGGVRNDEAFIHLFVHPPGTDPQQALAVVRAYEGTGGIPVSRGLEPIGESEAARGMAWADHAYAVGYQGEDGWYLGNVGIGTRDGRVFHLLTHYPAEYGDGFGPRASLVLETWRWADGEPLRSGPDSADFAIPSARADSAR